MGGTQMIWSYVFSLSKFSIGVCFCAALLRRIRQCPNKTSSRLQLMYFRAFVVQLLVGCACLLWPMCVAACTMAAGTSASQAITNVYLMLSSMHCTLDILVVLWFIKPYRKAILDAIRRVRRCTPPSKRNVDASAWP